jgi:hypothetical protein
LRNGLLIACHHLALVDAVLEETGARERRLRLLPCVWWSISPLPWPCSSTVRTGRCGASSLRPWTGSPWLARPPPRSRGRGAGSARPRCAACPGYSPGRLLTLARPDTSTRNCAPVPLASRRRRQGPQPQEPDQQVQPERRQAPPAGTDLHPQHPHPDHGQRTCTPPPPLNATVLTTTMIDDQGHKITSGTPPQTQVGQPGNAQLNRARERTGQGRRRGRLHDPVTGTTKPSGCVQQAHEVIPSTPSTPFRPFPARVVHNGQ